MKESFRRTAIKVSAMAGSAGTFLLAVALILIWAGSGPYFNYSDTWQLVINTTTTVVVFLMVFLIQNTQNRDSKAMQLKLDELILAHKAARDKFVGLEDLTDGELVELDNQFKKLRSELPETHPIHKLHKKIKQEHAKRLNLRGQAQQVISTLLNPLNPHGEHDDKKLK